MSTLPSIYRFDADSLSILLQASSCILRMAAVLTIADESLTDSSFYDSGSMAAIVKCSSFLDVNDFSSGDSDSFDIILQMVSLWSVVFGVCFESKVCLIWLKIWLSSRG